MSTHLTLSSVNGRDLVSPIFLTRCPHFISDAVINFLTKEHIEKKRFIRFTLPNYSLCFGEVEEELKQRIILHPQSRAKENICILSFLLSDSFLLSHSIQEALPRE